METIQDLQRRIADRLALGQRVVIGIDGSGGSGKSVLADQIASLFPTSELIHLDDFYKPSAQRANLPITSSVVNPNYDWDRLAREVFDKLNTLEDLVYQRYDWTSDRLAGWLTVQASTRVLVIEGVYALQNWFVDRYHIKIWVTAPQDLIVQRALERDGPDQLIQWTQEWMSRERHYYAIERPDQRADTSSMDTPRGSSWYRLASNPGIIV